MQYIVRDEWHQARHKGTANADSILLITRGGEKEEKLEELSRCRG
jgi:hypothetical protein